MGANLRPSSNALIWELVSLWLDRLSTGEVMATTEDGLEVDEVIGCSLVVCSGDDAARGDVSISSAPAAAVGVAAVVVVSV